MNGITYGRSENAHLPRVQFFERYNHFENVGRTISFFVITAQATPSRDNTTARHRGAAHLDREPYQPHPSSLAVAGQAKPSQASSAVTWF